MRKVEREKSASSEESGRERLAERWKRIASGGGDEQPYARWKSIVTWVCRLLVGCVFLYSGFVKAIDPWGTIFKFQDYLAAMHISGLDNFLFVATLLLCIYEFLTGAFLVTGSFRRAAPVMSALLMLFMTPLTLWIAIANPVADCGCFGDAIVISNWATFWKNVVICCATAWLLVYNLKSRWMIRPSLQWLGFVADALFVASVAMLGYHYQPLIDYRPYPIGKPLVSSAESDEPKEPQFIFVYEKGGERREFSIDDELPSEEDGWQFVERREIGSSAKDETEDGDLAIYDLESGENVTSDVLTPSGARMILFSPEISDLSIASSYRINSLFDFARANGIDFLAVVSGAEGEISKWRDLSMARYPIYLAEDTQIKEIVRGNPAVVYTEDGIIKWKSTLAAIPVDDFMEKGSETDPMKFAYNNGEMLRNIILLFLSLMGVLILLSFSPRLKDMFRAGR